MRFNLLSIYPSTFVATIFSIWDLNNKSLFATAYFFLQSHKFPPEPDDNINLKIELLNFFFGYEEALWPKKLDISHAIQILTNDCQIFVLS